MLPKKRQNYKGGGLGTVKKIIRGHADFATESPTRPLHCSKQEAPEIPPKTTANFETLKDTGKLKKQ